MEFSKRSWIVRETHGKKEGPGANYFSSSPKCVYVNEQGHLVMKIIKIDDKWTCSEVFLNESLGYGSYIFHVGKGHDNLPPQAVLGLFTYQSKESLYEEENKNKEIDIEISTWGNPNIENSQYVIQPYHKEGNIYRFSPFNNKNNSKNDNKSFNIVHAFTWQPEYILFQSYYTNNLEEVYESIGKEEQHKGQHKELKEQYHHPEHPIQIREWRYENKQYIPKPENECVHINFWLFNNGNVYNKQNLRNINEEQTIEILEFRFKELKE